MIEKVQFFFIILNKSVSKEEIRSGYAKNVSQKLIIGNIGRQKVYK